MISQLPLLPLLPDEDNRTATASANPREGSGPKSVVDTGEQTDKVAASVVEKPAISQSPSDLIEIRMQGTGDGSEVWFDPIGVLVQPGQTIRWVNRDPVEAHTVTAYHPKNLNHARRIPEAAEPWNSGYLQPNRTFSIRLTEEGVYDYFCIPHEKAGMVGRIVVGRPAGASEQSVGEVALGAGAPAVPEPARRAFPSIEEIMRVGVIHPQTAVPSKGEAKGPPAIVHPHVKQRAALTPETTTSPVPSRSVRHALARQRTKPSKVDRGSAAAAERVEQRRRVKARVRHGPERTAGSARHARSMASARQHIRPKRQRVLATVIRRGRSVETTGSMSARPRLRPLIRFSPMPVAPFVLPEVLRPRDL